MIKSIFFWGGVTTHCYELAKSISRYYEVWAIILPTKQKREERIPSELSANVNLIKCENIFPKEKLKILFTLIQH